MGELLRLLLKKHNITLFSIRSARVITMGLGSPKVFLTDIHGKEHFIEYDKTNSLERDVQQFKLFNIRVKRN